MKILCRLFGHDISYEVLEEILKHIRKHEEWLARKLTVSCKRCGKEFDFTEEALR